MYLPEIIIKSLKFDKIVYLDARDNPGFNKFSVLIVLLVGFCTGIGTYNLTNDTSIIRDILSSILDGLYGLL